MGTYEGMFSMAMNLSRCVIGNSCRCIQTEKVAVYKRMTIISALYMLNNKQQQAVTGILHIAPHFEEAGKHCTRVWHTDR